MIFSESFRTFSATITGGAAKWKKLEEVTTVRKALRQGICWNWGKKKNQAELDETSTVALRHVLRGREHAAGTERRQTAWLSDNSGIQLSRKAVNNVVCLSFFEVFSKWIFPESVMKAPYCPRINSEKSLSRGSTRTLELNPGLND